MILTVFLLPLPFRCSLGLFESGVAGIQRKWLKSEVCVCGGGPWGLREVEGEIRGMEAPEWLLRRETYRR